MKGMDPAILLRMRKVGLLEKDLEESFIRAGGHGGQNVNKVATCVVLRHRPSRLTVRCEETRTQGANRVLARLRMVEKLEKNEILRRAQKKQQAEKIKRQKRRPSKGARARNVDDKRQRGETKRGRGRVKDF